MPQRVRIKKAAPESAPLCIVIRQLVTAATATAAVFATGTAGITAAFFARTSDVDREGAAIERRAIHGFDRFVRFLIRAHRHEAKSARATGFTVGDQIRFG